MDSIGIGKSCTVEKYTTYIRLMTAINSAKISNAAVNEVGARLDVNDLLSAFGNFDRKV